MGRDGEGKLCRLRAQMGHGLGADRCGEHSIRSLRKVGTGRKVGDAGREDENGRKGRF